MHRRLPKIGFSNQPFKKTYQVVNLSAIEDRGLKGEIGPEELEKSGLIRKISSPVKILGEGDLTRNLTIKAHKFSQNALEKIAQVGGKAEVI
jgi:large subunit ribosomal protein L15